MDNKLDWGRSYSKARMGTMLLHDENEIPNILPNIARRMERWDRERKREREICKDTIDS